MIAHYLYVYHNAEDVQARGTQNARYSAYKITNLSLCMCKLLSPRARRDSQRVCSARVKVAAASVARRATG
jgi:hypothetical protein